MTVREDPRSITLPVLKIAQPIGTFFVGSIKAKDLVDIADFDIRRLTKEEGIDSYLGIQRELDPKRVQEIRLYVRGPDATFPTSVVLAVPEACVTLNGSEAAENRFFNMTLSNLPNSEEGAGILYRQIARVIDGQHRIEGLRGLTDIDFEVNISIFVGADIADQAAIFSTVNLAQTKVNRSLVYDLFELSKSRSPERTCHDVVVSLDRAEKSPFHKRIKRLGTATEGRFGETLSQATVVNGLLQYICKNRLEVIRDRQIGRRGGTFPPADPKDYRRLVLRPFFLRADDVGIAEVVWNYFEAVSGKWPQAWNATGAGMMLNRTNGFNALIRLFRPAYLYFAEPGQSVTVGQFRSLFDKSPLKDQDFNPAKFVPGTSGATELFHALAAQLALAEIS
jgi:DGQHR domain-containing protein